jgi:cell filamentation protein
MTDTVYCYPPDFKVLKNKLNLKDARELASFETEFVMQRISEGAPAGNFDLAHLKAIHRHLFQDVYEWAGELRTVEISKDGHQFQFRRFIETGMADVHRRLARLDSLIGLDAGEFARQAGPIMGDVNYVHPFREGNGRTQLLYLEQLADQAGHPLDLTRIDKHAWQAASREAHLGRYEPMAACIATAVRP